MPMCPMNGKNHVISGSGVHTTQYGYRDRATSIGGSFPAPPPPPTIVCGVNCPLLEVVVRFIGYAAPPPELSEDASESDIKASTESEQLAALSLMGDVAATHVASLAAAVAEMKAADAAAGAFLRGLKIVSDGAATSMSSSRESGTMVVATVPGAAGLAALVGDLRCAADVASELTSALATTSKEAEQVVSKVRTLDKRLRHGQQAFERLEDILDLQTCLGGVTAQLESDDLLAAATTIRRFHVVAKLVPVAPQDRVLMTSAEQSLLQKVTSRFDAAISSQNAEQVTLCCQLLSMLGRSETAAAQFTQYAESSLKATAAEQLLVARAGDPRGSFVNVLSSVFAKAAKLLQQAELLSGSLVDEQSITPVLLAIHKHADATAASIVKEFLLLSHVRHALQFARALLRAGLSDEAKAPPAGEEQDMAVYELDSVLDELVLVAQRCVSFNRLIHNKLATSREMLASVSAHAALAQAVGDLMIRYTDLEQAYVSRSVDTAIACDEPSEDGLTSSCPEDVCYVLQKCCSRAVATGHADFVSSAVNHAAAALHLRLLAHLRGVAVGAVGGSQLDRLARVLSKSSALVGSPLRGAGTDRDGATDSAVAAEVVRCRAINNLKLAATNIGALRASVQADCEQVFDERNCARINSCLMEFGNATDSAQQSIQAALKQLYEFVAPRIKSAVSNMEGSSAVVHYKLTADEFALREARNPFKTQVADVIVAAVQTWKPLLAQELYEQYVQLVAGHVARALDAALSQRTINQLGGAQWDIDLRSLMTAFAKEGGRTVRSQFTGLTKYGVSS